MSATKTTDRKQQLKNARTIECYTPSDHLVTIRPPNIEQHALSGGLPAKLKRMAAKGIKAIDDAIQEIDREADAEMLNYLDGIVARLFVDPEFVPPVWVTVEDEDGEPDEETGEKPKRVEQVHGDKLDEYLLPADYRWAVLVAFGEQDEDGRGNTLWGRAPLSRFDPFPRLHDCPPDCERCERARDSVSLARAEYRSLRAMATG